MRWIGKIFLLAVSFSLLIALTPTSWSGPLIQGPPPKATQSAQRAAQSDQEGDGLYYARLRAYVNATANYCTSERPNAASEWRKQFICDSKITDVIIAALTTFLMIFTGLLVWVGYRQEKTTRRQMRAFVYVNEGAVFNVAHPVYPLPGYKPTGAEIVSPTEGPFARLTIKNSGSTPAFRVAHWGGIHVAEFPLKSELPPIRLTKRAPHSALPPDSVNTKWVRFPQPLTAQQIEGLRNGTVAIWVYGEITYRDAFRRKHVSRYRLFHNLGAGTIGISTDLTWAEGGNEAN